MLDNSTASRVVPRPQNGVSSEEQRRQLELILKSQTFLASCQLRRFLEYVGNAAIDGRNNDIKEYTIGTTVFGRQNFDPRADTLVRTQASRLRARLEAYYRTEGSTDDTLVEIPKGHYVPHFARRTPDGEAVRCGNDNLAQPKVAARFRYVPWLRQRWLPLATVVALAVALYWKPSAAKPGFTVLSAHNPVAQLWSAFLDPQAPPIVCYSNHVFLINAAQDELYYYGQDNMPKGTQVDASRRDLPVSDPRLVKSMGPLFFNDGFTGTGEVLAVASLTRTFTLLGSPLLVRRSRLLTSADLSQRNVVFIGSPAVNGLLQELPWAIEFAFDRAEDSSQLWGERIVNRHPRPGEAAAYAVERDPATRALQADHAIVSIMPGIAPDKRVAILAGITTEGTQAAAEFATSVTGVEEIAQRLGTRAANGTAVLPPYFQAVLRVDLARGDVLRIRYVTGRVIRTSSSSPVVVNPPW